MSLNKSRAQGYEGPKPISLKLKLSKTTLELAEANVLGIEIKNVLGRPLLIDCFFIFNLFNDLSLFVISPDGEKWVFKNPPLVSRGAENKDEYLLKSGEYISEQTLFDLSDMLPRERLDRVESLPSGIYKVFACYSFWGNPDTTLNKALVFSDTVEFSYKPLNEKYLPVLREYDSLWPGNYSTVSVPTRHGRIRDSKTPYSEAAWVHLLNISSNQFDYDSLKAEKAKFDMSYPNSIYQPLILQRQLDWYLIKHHIYLHEMDSVKLDAEADSLLELCQRLTPRWVQLLKFTEKERFLTNKQARELFTNPSK